MQQPTEKTLGRYTNLGNAVSLDQYDLTPQNNDRFSLSYQREIWGRTIVSFDFFYNNGFNLPIDVDLNHGRSELPVRQPAFGDECNSSESVPQLPDPDIPRRIAQRRGEGDSCFVAAALSAIRRDHANQYGAAKLHVNSYKVQAQRPFAKGFSMLVNYAYQSEAQTEFFDDRAMYARNLTWRNLPIARHRFNHAITWEIPVGKGRWLLKNAPTAVDLVVGGWQLTTTNRWYSGRQLIFTQNLSVSGSPKVANPTFGAWFDKSVFTALPAGATADPASIVRTNPFTYDGVVGPGTSQVDMTMSKAFRIKEHFKFEVRVEGYNAFNQINWDNPVVDFNNANFGKVISKRPGYIGREIQYGLKLTF